jgi:hypothetical protein
MSSTSKYFREQAAVCRRIATGLSWNNPGCQQFLQIMAKGFEKSAAELESHEPPGSEKPDTTS